MLRKAALLLFIVSCVYTATHAQKQIRVLIVDGFSNHDWQQTTQLTKAIYSACHPAREMPPTMATALMR